MFALQSLMKIQVNKEFQRGFHPIVIKQYTYNLFLLVILAIFLKYNLNLSEDTSTFIYHANVGLMWTSAIAAAIIADQYLGKFKTIIWSSMMNIVGLSLITLVVMPLFKLPQM